MWALIFTPRAIKELRKIGSPIKDRVVTFLELKVATGNPLYYSKPLKGKFDGLYAFRVGKWCVVAEIMEDKLVILVVTVDKRGEVYR